MTLVLQGMKNEMNKLRIAEHEKLTKLTLESSAAIKELKRQKEKVSWSLAFDLLASQFLYNCSFFNGISTFCSYLMPITSFEKNISGTI